MKDIYEDEWTIMKSFHVATGHRLSKHKGLCKNIHGHNLKVEVYVSASKLNEGDMVIDFAHLKEAVKIKLEEFDHCLLVNSKDFPTLAFAVEQQMKHIEIPNSDPTAEILSQFLFEEIGFALTKYPNVKIKKIGIWESPTSYCTYKRKLVKYAN